MFVIYSIKVVYILRNPKDVIVSSYNFFSTFLLNQFVGTLSDMVDMFVNGETMYGAWYEHVNAYTSLDGVYIIHYEDLVEVRLLLSLFDSYLLQMFTFKRHICFYNGSKI